MEIKNQPKDISLKAGSKGQKLAAKRHARGKVGRPFTLGVAREPNGRISRAINPPEPADRLALEVRARLLGVSVEQARDPRLGSYIGRLAILGGKHGGLSEEQYEAARTFLEVRNNYQRAILSPAAAWDECVEKTFGETEEETTKRNIARYEAVLRAVQAAQLENPTDNLYAALQYLVIEDRELPHMIGTLRLLLNALYRHFF